VVLAMLEKAVTNGQTERLPYPETKESLVESEQAQQDQLTQLYNAVYEASATGQIQAVETNFTQLTQLVTQQVLSHTQVQAVVRKLFETILKDHLLHTLQHQAWWKNNGIKQAIGHWFSIVEVHHKTQAAILQLTKTVSEGVHFSPQANLSQQFQALKGLVPQLAQQVTPTASFMSYWLTGTSPLPRQLQAASQHLKEAITADQEHALNTLVQQQDSLDNQLAAKNHTIQTLTQQKETAEQLAETQQAEIKQYEAQRQSNTIKIQDLQTQLGEITQRYEEVNQRYEAMSQQLEAQQHKHDQQLEAVNASFNDRLNAQEARIQEFFNQLQPLTLTALSDDSQSQSFGPNTVSPTISEANLYGRGSSSLFREQTNRSPTSSVGSSAASWEMEGSESETDTAASPVHRAAKRQ